MRRIKDNALVPSLIAVAEQGGHVMAGVDAVDEWANSDQESVGIFRRWKLRMGEGEVLRTMRFGGAASTPVRSRRSGSLHASSNMCFQRWPVEWAGRPLTPF